MLKAEDSGPDAQDATDSPANHLRKPLVLVALLIAAVIIAVGAFGAVHAGSGRGGPASTPSYQSGYAFGQVARYDFTSENQAFVGYWYPGDGPSSACETLATPGLIGMLVNGVPAAELPPKLGPGDYWVSGCEAGWDS